MISVVIFLGPAGKSLRREQLVDLRGRKLHKVGATPEKALFFAATPSLMTRVGEPDYAEVGGLSDTLAPSPNNICNYLISNFPVTILFHTL